MVDVKSKKLVEPILVNILRYQDRLYVQNIDYLREQILLEVHSSRYSIHLGPPISIVIHGGRGLYLGNEIEKDITEFMTKYPNYQ